MVSEIYIELGRQTLYGWEAKKSRQIVEAIIRGIKAGDDFPPVPVHKKDEKTYYISPLWETHDGMSDGGHHRAIAHYLAGKSLKCELLEGDPLIISTVIRIQDIRLVDDPENYEERKKRFPNYK